MPSGAAIFLWGPKIGVNLYLGIQSQSRVGSQVDGPSAAQVCPAGMGVWLGVCLAIRPSNLLNSEQIITFRTIRRFPPPPPFLKKHCLQIIFGGNAFLGLYPWPDQPKA